MAIKRAHQRMKSFLQFLNTLDDDPRPTGSDRWNAFNIIVDDASRTQRAIEHALELITRYEDVRPHDKDKKALEELVNTIKSLRGKTVKAAKEKQNQSGSSGEITSGLV